MSNPGPEKPTRAAHGHMFRLTQEASFEPYKQSTMVYSATPHLASPTDSAMPCPKAIQKRVSTLTENFRKCTKKLERLYAAGRCDEYLKLFKGELTTIYNDACGLLRDAHTVNAPYCTDLLVAFQEILDEEIAAVATDVCCRTFKPQDYGTVTIVIEDQRIIPDPIDEDDEDAYEDDDAPKPHPMSSPFAIFSLDPPKLAATPANRSAMPVYDARCDISSVRDHKSRHDGRQKTEFVIDIQTSGEGSCLAVLGWCETKVLQPGGRWKTSKFPAPRVSCYFPGDPKSKFTRLMKASGHRIETGIAGIARHMTVDEDHRLIFVGDKDRIKSFEWATPNGSYHPRPLAKHTLDSKQFNGPIATLPHAFLVRPGTGMAGVWGPICHLDNHGPQLDQIIGKKIHINNECEYGCDYEVPHLEYSSGVPCSSEVRFVDDPKLKPDVWRALPHSFSTVLAADRMERSCVSIDLEHGGKTITRYQGHPGFVSGVSVSTADPHVFLTTSCQDEYARIFDVRRPEAVVKFAACEDGEECGAISLAHLDGIPTVFTASRFCHDFKVWDIRSRACVYELKTDEHHNSSIRSFAWNAGHNTLYSLKSAYDAYETYSDYSDDDDQSNHSRGTKYSRIYQYSFKNQPRHSTLSNDEPKLDEDEDTADDTDEDDFGYDL